MRHKTASAIANDVLQKMAVSSELAQRALANAYQGIETMSPKRALNKMFSVLKRYPLMTLRANNIPTEGFAAGRETLKQQERRLRIMLRGSKGNR
jgi:hypothetical protein